VLLGTASIEKNELLSSMLSNAGIPHELLNAKNNEREGAIIAQAGRSKAVTVATNVAGRGVDIILGGNPPEPEEARKVRELGGLLVIGTERHEARRIDNQLRGRAGRQGDPGVSQFFLSLEDDLLRIFGGDRIKNMMERFNLPEDEPIQLGFLSKTVAQAQAKVEGAHFDTRKHLLEYDDVLNKQRSSVYKRRFEVLGSLNKEELAKIIFEAVSEHFEIVKATPVQEGEDAPDMKKIFVDMGIIDKNQESRIKNQAKEELTDDDFREILQERSTEAANDPQAINRILGILDMLWMNHLEDLEALSESVGLRAYGQRDPLVEYRQEAHRLFKGFWINFNGWLFNNLFKLLQSSGAPSQGVKQQPIALKTNQPQQVSVVPKGEQVGRNDPCPCGSGKKYKYCHLNGKN